MFRRGKGRIRTDGPLSTIDAFQEHCNNPLCHFSKNLEAGAGFEPAP